MPLLNRKRRAQTEAEPSPAPTRRRESPEESSSASSSDDEANDISDPENTQASNAQQDIVKKLVRLALSSEYSRTPIRRSDVAQKVMPPGSGRQFNKILAQTNHQLRSVFGMELTPLPLREKATVSQKRNAQRANMQSQNAGAGAGSNKTYILTSTLPAAYRTAAILPPSRIPSAELEGGYMGFVSFVVGVVMLSPGQTVSEMRLEKQLKRVNADEYFGGERIEVVLKRMVRDGYVIKVKDRDQQGGEEMVDYVVGPRGRVEVGELGVAGLVRKVYGRGEGGRGEGEGAELERRLVRSLGDVVIERGGADEGGAEDEEDEEEGEGDTQTSGVVEEEPAEVPSERRSSRRGRPRRT